MEIVNISIGGEDLKIDTGKRIVTFEMHRWAGPTPLNRHGDPLTRIPSGFYDAIDRWESGGKLVVDGVCVVPEWCQYCKGTGDAIKALAPGHFEVTGRCKACDGIKVQAGGGRTIPQYEAVPLEDK